MTEKANVSSIVKEHLCSSCGACQAVCPTQSISYEETIGGHYFPRVSATDCTNCGLCRSVCPGIHLNLEMMRDLLADPFVGTALSCWVGKATDSNIFDNSQSGGIVSALLINALKLRFIETAFVVVMESGNPPRPFASLRSSKEEILDAQKSKYCPVPLLALLTDLEKTGRTAALVGLPCHMQGFSNIAAKFPKFGNLVKCKIGLICDRVMSFAGLDYLIDRSRLKPPDGALLLRFRDKGITGYPGDVTVSTQEGDLAIVPANVRMTIKDYFTPARCRLCFDKMNVFSDVTIGDPHGIEGVDRERGESIVVVRSQAGAGLVEEAVTAGAVRLRKIDYRDVITGQQIMEKRGDWRGYCEAWRKLGREMPDCYDPLKAYAPLGKDIHRYRKLRWALALDTFPSRKALIAHVDSRIRWRERLVQRLSKRPLAPFLRLIRWTLRNLMRIRSLCRGDLFGATLSGTSVEVRSVNLVNKGSELILRAILDRVSNSGRKVNVVVCPDLQVRPHEQLCRLGLYQRVELSGPRILWGRLDRLLPAHVRKQYGIVTDREINAILDASGFAYGDQWGPNPATAAAAQFMFWKKERKRIVVLPQALGPFTSSQIKKAFRLIADNADLIYARDRISYDHAIGLVGDRPNIKLAPDFTNLIHGEIPPRFDTTTRRFAIVPNVRMMQNTSEAVREKYLPFLVRCAKYLAANGAHPFVLIHEGEDDLRLGRQVARVVGSGIDVVVEDDPVYLKGILGSCDGVISSRYHGLVSALSQGVPSLATGWSHKYEMLMEDYGFPEGSIPVTAGDDAIGEKIDFILGSETRDALRARIRKAGEEQKNLSCQMWEEVLAVITETR